MSKKKPDLNDVVRCKRGEYTIIGMVRSVSMIDTYIELQVLYTDMYHELMGVYWNVWDVEVIERWKEI